MKGALCLGAVFLLMMGGSLLPLVKVLEADYEKAQRSFSSGRILSLCTAFGGGVFQPTCFNALLPALREKEQPEDQEEPFLSVFRLEMTY